MTDTKPKTEFQFDPHMINRNDMLQDKIAAAQPTLAAHFLGQHDIHERTACMVEPLSSRPELQHWPRWPGVPKDVHPFDPYPCHPPRTAPSLPRQGNQAPLIPQYGVRSRPQDAALVAKVEEFIRNIRKSTTGHKRTHFIMVLDKSTSMLKGKEMTIAGFNQQVQIIRSNAKDAGLVTVSLVVFDKQVKPLYIGMPVESLDELSAATYLPDGGTAMYDAVGSVLEVAMALPEASDPSTAFFISVLTDGEDLDSKYVSGGAVGQCVKQLNNTGRFTFALMGPEEHLNDLAQVLSLNKGNVEGFDPASVQSRLESTAAMAGATGVYMSIRGANMMASSSLYSRGD